MNTLFYKMLLMFMLCLNCIGVKAQETSPPVFVETNHVGRGGIYDFSISPDDRYLAVSGDAIWIYELPNLILIETITPDVVGRLDIQWSPDGQKLAVAAEDAILLLDTASWQQSALLEIPDLPPLLSIDWSPDSRFIVFPGHMDVDEQDTDGHLNNPTDVYVWDSVSEELTLRLAGLTAQVITVAWSPDGEKIAAGNELGDIRIWDAETGELVIHESPEDIYGRIWGLDWSPDSEHIAITPENSAAMIWDVKLGIVDYDWPYFTNLHWSNDGRRLLGTSFDTSTAKLRTWNIDDESFIDIIPERVVFYHRMEWSASNEVLVTYSEDGRLAVWNSLTGEIIASTDEHLTRSSAVAWSPDETQLAFVQGHTIKIWDFNSHSVVEVLTEHKTSISDVDWSSDGNYLASSSRDGSVIVWRAGTYEPLYTLKNDTSVTRVDWKPESNLLAYAIAGEVVIYDVIRQQIIERFDSHDYNVKPFWSTDGHLLATLSWPDIKVWETSNWEFISATPRVDVRDVAWSPDDQMIASANSDNISIWDAMTGRLIMRWNNCDPLGNGYRDVSWVSDNKYILTVGCSGQLQMWNVESGTLTDTLPITRDSFQKIIWSPTGTQFAVSGRVGTLPIWGSP